jgi:chitinase
MPNEQATITSLRPERHRLSWVHLFILIAISAGIGLIGPRYAMTAVADGSDSPSNAWFAPYVDATLTPTLHFEDATEQLSPNIVLGFVVADSHASCTPSWGTYYSLDAAARALDLDRRIVRLRERGGDAVVSFGGAANNELATVCKDAADLSAAYGTVIGRYSLTTLDFDIEGAAVADKDANLRRAQALKTIQGQKGHEDLAVWLTLPVDANGLTADGIALIDTTLAAGVKLAGVNGMTMDFGASRAGLTEYKATESALKGMMVQVRDAFGRAGQVKTDAEAWRMIGATPMIGLNDVPGETFSLDDARSLVTFANQVNLGRISFWSANRDVACGVTVDDDRVSNTCSGVRQEPLEFQEILGGVHPDDATGAPVAKDAAGAAQRDDPMTSPYPLWRGDNIYQAGDKVTWQGRVYQAKWYSDNDQPDAPVKHAWDTPWRYLGPVLDSDREAVRSAKQGTNGETPQWSPELVYVAGDQVEYRGQLFRALWWTQGDMPQQTPDRPYDHPWQYIRDLPPHGQGG